MIQIIPAILAKSEEQYKADITKLSNCESLKGGWVHIDFADNKFVQNQSIEPNVVKKIPANFTKEAHLMVSNPLEWIDGLAGAGFKRVIFHIECEDKIDEVISYAKGKSLEVGLAIKLDTPIEKLAPFISAGKKVPFISKIDMVLIMCIVPGFQGQPFITDSLEKVKKIKSKWSVTIEVDGAVKDENARQLIDAGAERLIVGSFLLKGNVEENLEKIWEALRLRSG